MCLRYQWEYDAQDRESIEFDVARIGRDGPLGTKSTGDDGAEKLAVPSAEAFPSSVTPIIILEQGERVVVPSYFGLTPAWAKDPSFGMKFAYNSRAETIMEKPTFRDPFHFRRCLVKIRSFSENLGRNRWLRVMGADGDFLSIAGLYELPNKHVQTRSHCLVTTTPNDLIEPFHDRMPVILSGPGQEVWLNPKTTPLEALTLLKPCPSEWLRIEEYEEESRRKKQKYLDLFDQD